MEPAVLAAEGAPHESGVSPTFVPGGIKALSTDVSDLVRVDVFQEQTTKHATLSGYTQFLEDRGAEMRKLLSHLHWNEFWQLILCSVAAVLNTSTVTCLLWKQQ